MNGYFYPINPSALLPPILLTLCQLIIKGCDRVIQLFVHDPAVIHIPLTQLYLQQLYSQSLEFQCAVADFVGDLNIHLPFDKLLQNLPTLNIRMGEKFSATPSPKAKTIFIDGSGKQGKLLSPGKKGMSGNIFFLEGTLPPNRWKFQGLFLPSSIGPKSLLT